MVDVMTYSIGELAELTGLSVKTIRFYSDRGVVPPTDRTPRGYRRYDASALARLELVRTLRDLGLDLTTIQHVLASGISLPDVLVTHASALDTQLRVLRTRRAVVRAAIARSAADNRETPADRGPAHLESLHRLARLSDSERQSLINNFLTAVFNEPPPTDRSDLSPADRSGEGGERAANGGGTSGVPPTLAAVRRTMNPELPDDPTSEQLDAWLELATLSQDPEFRDLLRQLALTQVATQPGQAPPRPDPIAILRDQLAPALAAGLDPTSDEAAHLIQTLNHQAAAPDAHLERAADPRRDRYFELLAVINGWPRPSASGPAVRWFLAARQAAATR
ncbi:DNA-binding transcriptional MerR regulator [Kribbella sp. VKM Ac-2527]|uniref:DNA-binding transcriptional MerR regulator n=1 Tax=Kribbella caucasensis TaxID=2512215 RepID=A0A4R6KQD7_9ACTN|nr:MerR family transcriptional regulator [Kribbella sp. VKM Ac-2527]TDO54314.1 DNA-binding transcriptional MerR regulator [Kribbella sp. VKM Ac-2527]